MTADPSDELLSLTKRLLTAVAESDWDVYVSLCSADLTCFEAETCGHQVTGLAFHKFYFERGGHMGRHAGTIIEPLTRLLGPDVGLVTYTRLVQFTDERGNSASRAFQETRVWQRRGEGWKLVHFHRS